MERNNKTVIITGAASGIGKATSLAFSREGFDLLITDKNSQGLYLLAEEIRGKNTKVITVVADLLNVNEVIRIPEKALEYFGKVDVLVNNAAFCPQEEVVNMSLDIWNNVISVNLTAPMLLCKGVLPNMISRNGGCIVNVTSRAAIVGRATKSPYCASKAALNGFTRALAKEVAVYGIRVNSLLPGPVNTPMFGGNPELMTENVMEPETISDAILFLSSDSSSGINGIELNVFGSPWP